MNNLFASVLIRTQLTILNYANFGRKKNTHSFNYTVIYESREQSTQIHTSTYIVHIYTCKKLSKVLM